MGLTKKEKSGSGAQSGRKEYMYFQQLSFLQNICCTKPHEVDRVEDPTLQENIGENAPSTSKIRKRKSTVHSDEQDILHALAKKANAQPDHDQHFILSLVPDLKCIPESAKFDAKLEIMNVVKKYKHQNLQYFPPYQQTVPGPYSLTSHASYNFGAPNIMHAQPTALQSQPILCSTPTPALSMNHASQNVATNIMHAQSTALQSQPIPSSTPSPRKEYGEEAVYSPWSDDSTMSKM